MRLFVAAELPESVRGAVAARVGAERAELPPASWVRSENLHLTLLFLGEVTEAEAVTAASAFAGALAGSRAIEASVTSSGAFPARGPIRVIWLGLEPAGPLAALAGLLRESALAARLPFDPKPFHPHLTLARCRRPWPDSLRSEIARLQPPSGLSFTIDRLALISSVLGGGGAGGSSYSTVAALPLRAAA